MHSYRIVIEYTDATDGQNGHPETWDWWSLVDIGTKEMLSVMSVEDIETPDGHMEEIMQDKVLDELAEIAQKHDMGY
jgi:hypothetical protein